MDVQLFLLFVVRLLNAVSIAILLSGAICAALNWEAFKELLGLGSDDNDDDDDFHGGIPVYVYASDR
ncbi:MAG: hypothetical protein HY986_02480 [Candidatus Melainabacteria bacterium]|nr:hypothetical protein [Candidatus Melainabacteria bacterium]